MPLVHLDFETNIKKLICIFLYSIYKKMSLTKEEKKITKAEYDKKYNEKNKEKIKEQRKKYKEQNKEKIKDKNKEYREQNKDKIKEYSQTSKGKKIYRIANWKRSGVISNDFDELYEEYLSQTNCEECNIELTYDRNTTPTTKCLDHNHETGEFRNILCNMCNVRRR